MLRMDNFGRATDLATSALNSQGSAMEKYNIYADSIAGTTERITALWQDFVNRVDLESVIKGLLDLLEQIAKVLNNDIVALIIRFGTLPAIFAALSVAVAKSSVAIKGFTGAMAGAGAATSAFSPQIVLIAAAIGLVVTAIAQIVASYQTWDEKLEDTTAEIRELESELSTLEDAIENNKEKIKELMEIKDERQLTIVEAEELENLIKENEELERQKTLNDIILEQKKEQAQIEAENAFASSNVYIGEGKRTVSGRYGGVMQTYSMHGNYAEGLKYQIDRYKEAQEEMNKYAEEGNEYRYEIEKEKAEDAMELIEEYKDKMETIQDNLPEDSPYLDEIEESFDYLINQLGSVEENFNNIWNDIDFSDVTNELYELAKNGELAADALNSPAYSEFKNKIDAAGISVEDFVGYVYGLIETADDAATSVNNLGVETQTYSTIIDAIQPKIDAITQAEKDMSDQGYLSIDTIKDLETEFGDLTGVLQLTANGYVITTDKLQDLSEAALAQYNIELQNAQTAAEEVLGAEYLKQSGYDGTVESILTLLEATRALYAVEAKKLLLEPNIDYKKVFEYSQLIGEIAKSENDIRTAQENLDRAEHLLDTGLREGTTTSSSSTSNETKEVELTESAYEKLNRDLEYNLELSKQRRQMYEDTEQMDKWQEEAKVQEEILNQLQKAAHEEADRLRKENEDIVNEYGDNITNEMRNIISANEKTIQELSESWWDWEQGKRDLAKETADYLEELAEKEAEEYEKMIEGKIDALEDEIEKIENARDKANDLLDELNDAIDREIDKEQEKYDLIVEGIEKQIEAEEEAYDRLNENLDYQITKLEAIKELTSTYFDLTNQIEEERRNINSELKVSKESYKYLTDELRETIFNEKDYKVLSDKLNDIADSSAQLYEQYLSDLENLTEDEIWKAEQITTEFQNQYELKEMEYNIAKAELDVVKAQTELQNVKANRNVRMYKDGKWIWTYDFEAAANAEQQLADAENELENAKIKYKQEQILLHYDNLIAQLKAQQQIGQQQHENVINGLNQQKELAKQQFEQVKEYWEGVQESLKEPVRSINEILDEINSDSIPGFKDSVGEVSLTVDNVGDALQNFITQMEETIKALEAKKSALENSLESTSVNNFASGGGGGGGGGGSSWAGGTVAGSTEGSIIDGKVTATINGIGGGDVPLEYNPTTGKVTSSGLKPGDIVHTQGGDFKITGGTAGNYESIKVNKSYDSGGILNGMGNIKATDKDEVVFGPDITSKILSPEKSREFLSVANALSSMLDNSSALANVMRAIIGGAKINQQVPSMTDSHDIYLPSGFMSSMTQNDQSTISSIIRRYIPITQGG